MSGNNNDNNLYSDIEEMNRLTKFIKNCSCYTWSVLLNKK
jgi:hypothetical protein